MNKVDANRTARLLAKAHHYGITLCQRWDTKAFVVRSYNECGNPRRYESLADALSDCEDGSL